MRDWLPSRRVDQPVMARNWYTALSNNSKKWSVPDAVKDELEVMIKTAQDSLFDAMPS
jgi:hypothetical protein